MFTAAYANAVDHIGIVRQLRSTFVERRFVPRRYIVRRYSTGDEKYHHRQDHLVVLTQLVTPLPSCARHVLAVTLNPLHSATLLYTYFALQLLFVVEEEENYTR